MRTWNTNCNCNCIFNCCFNFDGRQYSSISGQSFLFIPSANSRVPFYTPWKYQSFSDDFSGYRKRILACNEVSMSYQNQIKIETIQQCTRKILDQILTKHFSA